MVSDSTNLTGQCRMTCWTCSTIVAGAAMHPKPKQWEEKLSISFAGQSINQSIDRRIMNQSTNQSINQSINQPIDRSTRQRLNGSYRLPRTLKLCKQLEWCRVSPCRFHGDGKDGLRLRRSSTWTDSWHKPEEAAQRRWTLWTQLGIFPAKHPVHNRTGHQKDVWHPEIYTLNTRNSTPVEWRNWARVDTAKPMPVTYNSWPSSIGNTPRQTIRKPCHHVRPCCLTKRRHSVYGMK